MRNVFFVVLAANVFIFMFYYYLPDQQQAVKSSIPAGTKKLVLLSEVDKATLTKERVDEVASRQVEKSRAVPAVHKQLKKCFTIGPFREENHITAFRSQIGGKVSNTSVRERVEKQHWRYWVYLPAQSSRAKAVKLASELAKKGLKDYYVIARGEHLNSVSLGHFKDKLLAENRFNAIKKMGYKPKMTSIEKEYTLYWLDYVSKNSHGLSNTTLNSFELEESIHQFNRECQK